MNEVKCSASNLQTTNSIQGKKIREHIEEGGAVYPITRAIIVGLTSLVVVVTVIFGIAFLLDRIGGLQV